VTSFDPVVQDPVTRDPLYPPTMTQVAFDSAGSRLIGALLVAQGRGPHPTVVLLHGFPGFERNFDLAQAVRRAGWNALVFHYRGCWGSQGTYAFQHVLEDVGAALGYLGSDEARAQRIDPERTALVGHSLGGFAALMSAAKWPQVRAVASLSGVNFGAYGAGWENSELQRQGALAFFEEGLTPLQGTSAQALLDEVVSYAKEWNLVERVAALCARPVLLVGASQDEVIPTEQHHEPLVCAFERAGATALSYHVLDCDHGYSNCRIALAHLLIDWLDSVRQNSKV